MKNLVLLDNQKKPICIIANRLPKALPFFEDTLTRDLDNFSDELKISFPANNEKSKLIAEDYYILYPVNDKYCLYRIKKVVEESSDKHIIEVECEISVNTDLLMNLTAPTKFEQTPVATVLQYILGDTGLSVGEIDDFGLIDFNISSYVTRKKALVDLCNQLEAEYFYSYDVRGATIMEEKVNIVKEMGSGEISKLFIKEKDLDSVKRTVDTTKLITAIIGEGSVNSEGNNISYTNMQISLPQGYVQQGDMIYSEEALEKYGVDGRHIIGVNKDDDARDGLELAENSLKILKAYEKPICTYEAKVLWVKEKMEEKGIVFDLGDKIFVQDKTMSTDLYLQARIRKITTSLSNPEKDELVFGDYIKLHSRNISDIERLQEIIRDHENVWNGNRWSLEVESDVGAIFPNGVGTARVKAVVLKDNKEFDPYGTILTYRWTKTDINGEPSLFPNGESEIEGKEIVVNAQDFDRQGTYNVTVEIDEKYIV